MRASPVFAGAIDRAVLDTGIAPELADLAIRTIWQVKASTLCNLRCRYCYEWDRLSDRTGIPIEGWR